MRTFSVLAEAFRYPAPGQIERLEGSLQELAPGPGQKPLGSFCRKIRALSLGEWEELYTRTWDLNPVVPPYVGFQIWGEDYRRGNFMACLQRAYLQAGIEPDGELPDHLHPVLHYLEEAAQPIPELREVIGPAVEKIEGTLRKRDPQNPYLDLLAAVRQAVEAVQS